MTEGTGARAENVFTIHFAASQVGNDAALDRTHAPGNVATRMEEIGENHGRRWRPIASPWWQVAAQQGKPIKEVWAVNSQAGSEAGSIVRWECAFMPGELAR